MMSSQTEELLSSDGRRGARKSGCFPAEQLQERMREETAFQELLALGFELPLDDAKAGKDKIPIRVHPSAILRREIAHPAKRGHALQHIHRLARELGQQTQFREHM